MTATLDLARAIEEAEPGELPGLVATFAEAHALALRRLVEEAARPPAVVLLTVAEAAELAKLPRRRVFSLSRRAPWAVRVGRRLLVEESAFRRWLLDPARDVRAQHETTRRPVLTAAARRG